MFESPVIYNEPSFVPFEAGRIAEAKVVWSNDEWFHAKDIDAEGREEILARMLRIFGVSSEISGGSEQTITLNAQRYGGTGGASHGGAGRGGSAEGYNAKGIGRTPLASDTVDLHHAHGCLWLHEAVRDVIWSEISAIEMPAGGVPVIAIIDLGISVVSEEGELYRRAVLVRPDFRRPAELERSRFFGTSGWRGSDQYLDARSVRANVLSMTKQDSFDVEELFDRLGRQFGHCAAWRTWPGQFSSANVTISGAFCDFGSFCALPDWRKAKRFYGEIFGEERAQVAEFAQSLAFFLGKYGTTRSPGPNELAGLFDRSFASSLNAAFEAAAGPARSATHEAIRRVLQRVFDEQQSCRTDYESEASLSKPWLSNLIDRTVAPTTRAEQDFVEMITHLSPQERLCIANFLRPRTNLYQASFEKRFRSRFNPSGCAYEVCRESITKFVREELVSNER